MIRKLAGAFAPLLAPLFGVWNRMRNRGDWVVALGGRSYARLLVKRLHELGYRTLLIDSAPGSLNWRFAARSVFLNPYAPANIPEIVALARRHGARIALMQSDDKLLPIMAQLNETLGAPVVFSDLAVRSSVAKIEMRQAFASAGMKTVAGAKLLSPDDIRTLAVPFPLVAKADTGQGAKQARICGNASELREAMAAIPGANGGSAVIVERLLPGRQFNVDGLLSGGAVHIYLITEECYDLHAPYLMPCWYIFGASPDKAIEAEIVRCASESVLACGFRSGAFHCEVRFDGDRAFAIDLSNRIGADFPKYASMTMGNDLVGDYIGAMHGRPIDPPSRTPIAKALRYYNYAFDPSFEAINSLGRNFAEGTARLEKASSACTRLELRSDAERPLWKFLGEIDAIRDHHRHRS